MQQIVGLVSEFLMKKKQKNLSVLVQKKLFKHQTRI
jgi:hypothetical protein